MKVSKQARQRERLAQLKLLSTFERPLTKKVSKIIASQGKTAAAYYTVHKTVTSEALIQHKLLFKQTLIASYTRVITAFANRIRRSVKDDSSSFEAVMKNWLVHRALETIDDIDDTTLEMIRTAIKHGVEQGWGVNQIAKTIVDATSVEVNTARAKVIARTEMHTASQEGQLQAAKSTKIKGLTKTWTAALDNRTRETHSDADGQTVDIDDDFTVGGESISRRRFANRAARQWRRWR